MIGSLNIGGPLIVLAAGGTGGHVFPCGGSGTGIK